MQCEDPECRDFAEGFCTYCGYRMCPNTHVREKEAKGCPKCGKDCWNTGWWNTAARHQQYYEEDDF